jgi:hypothetical protein
MYNVTTCSLIELPPSDHKHTTLDSGRTAGTRPIRINIYSYADRIFLEGVFMILLQPLTTAWLR